MPTVDSSDGKTMATAERNGGKKLEKGTRRPCGGQSLYARRVGPDGLATQVLPEATTERPDNECPFCGGRIVRVEIVDGGGERAFSLCCQIPLELLDNYDVIAALPEPLQQKAIADKKAQYAAMDAKAREDARLFQEAQAHWYEKYAHLIKESQNGD